LAQATKLKNDDTNFGLDYNRVKIRILKFAPSVMKLGRYGSVNFQTLKELKRRKPLTGLLTCRGS
jgi:hypothetical protein